MTETTFAKRPLSQQEERQLVASIRTFEPMRNWNRLSPLDRRRGRLDAGLSEDELAKVLGCSAADIERWEAEEYPVDGSETYSRFCNMLREDCAPKPERYGLYPAADVRKWNRAKHRPSNALKQERDADKVVG